MLDLKVKINILKNIFKGELIMCDNMIKKNCFAFDEENFDCKALNKLYCTKEKCCFYKTKERNEREEKAHTKYILKM